MPKPHVKFFTSMESRKEKLSNLPNISCLHDLSWGLYLKIFAVIDCDWSRQWQNEVSRHKASKTEERQVRKNPQIKFSSNSPIRWWARGENKYHFKNKLKKIIMIISIMIMIIILYKKKGYFCATSNPQPTNVGIILDSAWALAIAQNFIHNSLIAATGKIAT